MTYLLAFVSLMIIVGVAIWARRPGDDAAGEDADAPATPDFTLDRSVLVIGPEINDPACCEQRTELKRILMPLLQGGYRIVEVYGDDPPTQNGEVYDWLDNQLLRDTLNARSGFNLIFVDDKGQMLFHSTRAVIAEALLHIFDLWEHIGGEAGEALAGEAAESIEEEAQPEAEEMPAAAYRDEPPAEASPGHGIIETVVLHEADARNGWHGVAEKPEQLSWRPAALAVTTTRDFGARQEAGSEPRIIIRGLGETLPRPDMLPVSLPVDRFQQTPQPERDSQPFAAMPAERGSVTVHERPARRQAPSHITQLVRSRRRA